MLTREASGQDIVQAPNPGFGPVLVLLSEIHTSP